MLHHTAAKNRQKQIAIFLYPNQEIENKKELNQKRYKIEVINMEKLTNS